MKCCFLKHKNEICNILSIIKWKVYERLFVLFYSVTCCLVTVDDMYMYVDTNHTLGLGFRIALLPIGFFLLLIAPTSSDPHHHENLSHMEIWRQTTGWCLKHTYYRSTWKYILFYFLLLHCVKKLHYNNQLWPFEMTCCSSMVQ